MYVTSELTPAALLSELLNSRRTSAGATTRFQALRHDKDLVPHFASQIDSVLDVYKAYRTDVHDIQGMRDDGVDVLFRSEQEGEQQRVGLQIKSNDEFDQWRRKKLNMVEKLKAQYSAARENARVDDYYVVLCADANAHRKRIRMICSELKNYSRCTIIEPEYALGFFDMSGLDLLVRSTRLLCDTDTILREALSETDSQEPDVAFFFASLVCFAFENGQDLDNSALFSFGDHWTELTGEAVTNDRMSEVIQTLFDEGVLGFKGSDYVIDVTRLPVPVCALYFDLRVHSVASEPGLRVRSVASGPELRDYLVGLLELKERAISESDDYDDEDEDDDDN